MRRCGRSSDSFFSKIVTADSAKFSTAAPCASIVPHPELVALAVRMGAPACQSSAATRVSKGFSFAEGLPSLLELLLESAKSFRL